MSQGQIVERGRTRSNGTSTWRGGPSVPSAANWKTCSRTVPDSVDRSGTATTKPPSARWQSKNERLSQRRWQRDRSHGRFLIVENRTADIDQKDCILVAQQQAAQRAAPLGHLHSSVGEGDGNPKTAIGRSGKGQRGDRINASRIVGGDAHPAAVGGSLGIAQLAASGLARWSSRDLDRPFLAVDQKELGTDVQQQLRSEGIRLCTRRS